MAKAPKKPGRSTPLAAEIGRTARYAVRETTGRAVQTNAVARDSGASAARSKAATAGKRFALGRDSFAKISAVEGIRLTREMKQDFREFDRKGLSAAERRRAIVNKYGRKAT